MVFLDYNVGIPDAPNNPSDDQPLMKINFDSIEKIIKVDHEGFKDTNNHNGYHTVIHQVVQPVDPAAVVGFNEVYSKLYTPNYTGAPADTQLFNRTGGGGVSQLTGNASATIPTYLAETESWQWIGGLLIQTGWVPFVPSGTLTFKDRHTLPMINFPNICFVVVGTPTVTIGATGSATLVIGGPNPLIDKDQFSWAFHGNTTGYTGFNWIAIGR